MYRALYSLIPAQLPLTCKKSLFCSASVQRRAKTCRDIYGNLQIAEAAESDRLATVAQVMHRNGVLTDDFGFSHVFVCLDSTKVVMGMMMDAFQPFMGEYFQV